MLKPCTTFACKTDDHNRATEGLSRCADLLYEWLLRQSRAGSPAEIHLEAFQDFQQHRFKGRGYSLAWIKQALRELVDVKLVDIAFKFSSKIFKLITWHPDRQSAADLKKSLETARKNQRSTDKNREKQPSNPCSAALFYIENKDFKETTDRPITHPVLKDKQSEIINQVQTLLIPKHETKAIESIPTPPEPEIEPKILDNLKATGFQLNSTLKAIVRSTQAQIVLQAIEATQQYLTKLQQKNQPLRRQPEALLVSAIREEWRPQRGESGINAMPPDFDDWLKASQSAGLASNSSIQADVTGHSPGVLCVLTVSGDWIPYDEMRRLHSLAEVKQLAVDRQAKIVFTPSPRMQKTHS